MYYIMYIYLFKLWKFFVDISPYSYYLDIHYNQTIRYLQTRDDFLGLVEIPLNHTTIVTERPGRDVACKDYILRPRR
jgi:hypothetical protein